MFQPGIHSLQKDRSGLLTKELAVPVSALATQMLTKVHILVLGTRIIPIAMRGSLLLPAISVGSLSQRRGLQLIVLGESGSRPKLSPISLGQC